VSSRGEFKTIGGSEFVEVTAIGGRFEFVEATVTGGVIIDGMSHSHAARNNAARTNAGIFRKSQRKKSFFI
jgi:hypothetical protein